MSRLDREFGGSSRVSQHDILQVHERDNHGQTEFNPKISSENVYWEKERELQPLSVKLSELVIRP